LDFLSFLIQNELHVSFCCVQYGFIPYVVMTLIRGYLTAATYLTTEILIMLVNPFFGMYAGLGYITEVCCCS